MNSIINASREKLFELRMLAARKQEHQLIYFPLILKGQIKLILNRKNPLERLVRPKTELVIDGFQGSANSFATAAFKNAQTKPVKLAHHLHSPIQIIEAVERNIPVILFIREPFGAVLSLTSRWSYISVNSGLKAYIDFYRTLEPFSEGYVVSTFKQTTQSFDSVIKNVNHKFETNFDLIDISQAEKKHKPSQTERKQIKEQKKQEFEWKINTKVLAEANNIYRKFESFSVNNNFTEI